MKNGIVRTFISKKRIIAISDIHGHFNELIQLIKIIKFVPEYDVLIFLGDYLDRGKMDFEVVDYLNELRKNNKKSVYLLKGNHEDMAELALSNPKEIKITYGFGTVSTPSEYMINWRYNGANKFTDDQEKFLLKFIKTLPMYLMTDTHLFVHAGCWDNGVDINDQNENTLLWDRSNHNGYKGRIVIAGHTPTWDKNINKICENKVIIDTGVFRSGVLIGYDVLNDMVYRNKEN